MKIINLTQHVGSKEQVESGVFEPESKPEVCQLMTFDEIPTPQEISFVASKLAVLAKGEGATHAMIGGAPYLMASLEAALISKGIFPLYSFSKRVSVEEVKPDGSVEKKSVFRHEGFVEVPVIFNDSF